MSQLYWDSIELGDPVAPLSKPAVSRVQIAKFAGAAQDWSPLHIDDDFAKSAGYGSVFAHGAMSLGFAVEAVEKWLENGRVLSSSATFQKLVWPGDILTAKGVVVSRYEKNGEPRVDIDVWAENQNHDIVMKGQVTCLLWHSEKEEKKAKSPWPPVSSETIKERRTAKPVPKSEVDAQKARLEAAQVAQQSQHAAEARKVKSPPKPSASPPPTKASASPPPSAKETSPPASKVSSVAAAKVAPSPSAKPTKATATPVAASGRSQPPVAAKAPKSVASAPKAQEKPVASKTAPLPAKSKDEKPKAKAIDPKAGKSQEKKPEKKLEKKAEKKVEKKPEKKPEKKAEKKPEKKPEKKRK
jgi:acyl dehydratase